MLRETVRCQGCVRLSQPVEHGLRGRMPRRRDVNGKERRLAAAAGREGVDQILEAMARVWLCDVFVRLWRRDRRHRYVAVAECGYVAPVHLADVVLDALEDLRVIARWRAFTEQVDARHWRAVFLHERAHIPDEA